MSRSWRLVQISRCRQALPGALALVAAGSLALGTAAPAAASSQTFAPNAKPRATFSFKENRINSTAKPIVRYSSANLASGSKLELERQFGTARVWKNVALLKGRSGKETVPRVQMGRYRYRIRVYRKGQTVVFSATKLLYSYSRIPLANVCNDNQNNGNVYVNDTSGCQTSTVQVNGTVFTYLIQDDPPQPPNYDQDVTFGASTTCRSISLQFSMDNNAQPSDTAYLELVQSSADPQKASAGDGQIGNAYFGLSGGPWDLDLSVSGNDNEYVNGYLSCWSASGLS